MKTAVPPLERGIAHVWVGRIEPSPPQTDGAWLSAAERTRADSFRFPADRNRFILARRMLRGLLGEYLNIDPVAIEFAAGEFAKPYAPVASAAEIEFNCSRSGELALCAFCRGREVGVDVELVRTDLDLVALASTAFSTADVAEMSAVAASDMAERFFSLWTRKEAAAKLSGAGLNADIKTVDKSGTSLVQLAVPAGYIAHLATAVPVEGIRLMRWCDDL